jgi:DNA-binding response OmpR family regulator
MSKKKILIIDDDVAFGRMAKLRLEETDKYEVKTEAEGEEAIAAVRKFEPDLILLDIMMPGTSGFKICKELKEKEKFSSIPIIILSGKRDESDKVSGLDIGADDYIVKPFSASELDSRIRAVLRRAGKAGEEKKITVGNMLVMDLEKYEVTVKGKKVELTATEFTILKLLASRKTQVFTRSRILDYLWGEEKLVIERTIDVHIRHLREKLGKAAKFIQNVRGVGYKLEEDE